jgi:hypothetical protein
MRVVFSVFEVDRGTREEILVWRGTTDEVFYSRWDPAPLSGIPRIGYGQAFRVEWDVLNGQAVGYQYNVSAVDTAASDFMPRDQSGVPQFGDRQGFTFLADPDSLSAGVCTTPWSDCPEYASFPSGPHQIRVIAVDDTGTPTDLAEGTLTVQINYPPVTWVTEDDQYPRWTGQGGSAVFAPNDTVPAGTTVEVRIEGYDRLASNQDLLPVGIPCCDRPISSDGLDFGLQARFRSITWVDEYGREREIFTSYGRPSPSDVLSFVAGYADYVLHVRGVDEWGTRDPQGDTIVIHGGYPPRVTRTVPAAGDRVLLRFSPTEDWPENDVPFTAQFTTRYWDPRTQHFERDDGDGRIPYSGFLYRYEFLFEGASDARESTIVGSWSFDLVGIGDPSNEVADTAIGDAFGTWTDTSTDNVWNLSASGQGPSIFVPIEVWTSPSDDLVQTDPADSLQRIATAVARTLGDHTLRVKARIGHGVVPLAIPSDVLDPSSGETIWPTPGRESEVVMVDYTVLLGRDTEFTGQIGDYWPPAGYDIRPPQVVDARTTRDDAVLVEFDEDLDQVDPVDASAFRLLAQDDPRTRVEVVSVAALSPRVLELQLERTPSPPGDYVLAYRGVRDAFGTAGRSWRMQRLDAVDVDPGTPTADRIRLHPPRPNPFNPSTTISFDLDQITSVDLSVFDTAGRKIASIVDGIRGPGFHEVFWSGRDNAGSAVSSGVYYVRLAAARRIEVQKVVIVR